jgi:hypothetical protein
MNPPASTIAHVSALRKWVKVCPPELADAIRFALPIVEKAVGPGEIEARGPAPASERTHRPETYIRESLDTIARATCSAMGLDVQEFYGRGRHSRVVAARMIATVLARQLTTASYPEIAKRFGRPNHSTVITACQRALGRLQVAGTFASEFERVRAAVYRDLRVTPTDVAREKIYVGPAAQPVEPGRRDSGAAA